MATGNLNGRVALVTGGSRGIGAGIVRALAAEGAAVVVNYAKSKDAALALVGEVTKAGGKAAAVAGDLAAIGGATALAQAGIAAFGRVDILVNNAGIAEFSPIADASEEHVRRQFELNVFALLAVTRAVAPVLPSDGTGRIINLSSVASRGWMPAASAYAGTKAAVDAITTCLAAELGPRKITVNAVAPGPVATDMYHGVAAQMELYFLQRTPLARIGQPKDIADVVAFLASDHSAWITGQILDTAGGFRA